MNLFNIIWIFLCWMLGIIGVAACLDTQLQPWGPMVVIVLLTLLITTQTIVCDRAERDFRAKLKWEREQP